MSSPTRHSQNRGQPRTGQLSAARPRTVILGWPVPVWLLRTGSVILAAVLAVAVYVLVTSSLQARADAEYRGCQVDQLQRATTVDRTIDILIDTQVRLVDATTTEAKEVRRTAAAELDEVKRQRVEARAAADALCRPPR